MDQPAGLVAHGAEGFVTGGRLRQKDGSGTMMIDPMFVQDESDVLKEFTLSYTAATYIQNAVLTITVPNELLGFDPANGGTYSDPLQVIQLIKGGSDD